MNCLKKVRSGFSMIELLVVIGITATLVGLVVPMVLRVRDTAARAKTTNYMKQIGMAIQDTLSSGSRQEFPPTYGAYPDGGFHFGKEKPDPNDPTHRRKVLIPHNNYGSIFYYLLPRLQNETLFQTIKTDGVPMLEEGGAPNAQIGVIPLKKNITAYVAPSDPNQDQHLGLTSFVTNNQVFVGGAYGGANTILPDPYSIAFCKTMVNANGTPTFGGNPDVPSSHLVKLAEINNRVGLSNCAFLTERYAVSSDAHEYPHFWGSPNLTFDSTGNETFGGKMFQVNPAKGAIHDAFAQTSSGTGIQVLMGDGAVRKVSPKVSQTSWQTAFNPHSTQSLDSDF